MSESKFTWHWVTPFGHSGALASVTAGPVSLLAGFSLAALVANLVEIGTGTRSNWDDGAAVLLAVAVASLLIALRLLLVAQHWAVSPSQILELYPEATDDPESLTMARKLQRRHLVLYVSCRERAEKWIPCGIAAALFGLGLMAVNLIRGERWILIGVVAVLAVSGIVTLLELVRERPWFLFPDLQRWDEIVRRDRQRKLPRQTIHELSTDEFDPGTSARANRIVLHDASLDPATALAEVARLAITLGKSQAFAEVLAALLPRTHHFRVLSSPAGISLSVDRDGAHEIRVMLAPSMHSNPAPVYLDYDIEICGLVGDAFSTVGFYKTATSVRGFADSAAQLGGLLLLPVRSCDVCAVHHQALLSALALQTRSGEVDTTPKSATTDS